MVLYFLVGILILTALCRKWCLAPITSFKIIAGATLLAFLAVMLLPFQAGSLYAGSAVVFFQGLFSAAIILWCFYRDPDRVPPNEPHAVLSPADGRVIYVKRIGRDNIPTPEKSKRRMVLDELKQSSLRDRELWQIGISMVFTDVHVNRSPIAGKVTLLHHHPGKFLSLRDKDALGVNERQTLLIENERVQLAVVQIASRLVRQIQAYVREGDAIAAGQRIGIIKFGSQVDLIIPADVVDTIHIQLDQALVAGETVLCRLSSAKGK